MFKSKLQLDVGGVSTFMSTFLSIQIGEIKSGSQLQEGSKQLTTNLAILRQSSRVLLDKANMTDIPIHTQGYLFTTTEGWAAHKFNHKKLVKSLHLNDSLGLSEQSIEVLVDCM
jgi:hypothetical protein